MADIAAGGNIFFRPNHLPKAGDKVDGHTHNFDHVTVIWEGSVRVVATKPDGTQITQDFSRSEYCLIKADTTHEITALEDNTIFWCCYAHRTPQGDVVQQFNGWMDAYE